MKGIKMSIFKKAILVLMITIVFIAVGKDLIVNDDKEEVTEEKWRQQLTAYDTAKRQLVQSAQQFCESYVEWKEQHAVIIETAKQLKADCGTLVAKAGKTEVKQQLLADAVANYIDTESLEKMDTDISLISAVLEICLRDPNGPWKDKTGKLIFDKPIIILPEQ